MARTPTTMLSVRFGLLPMSSLFRKVRLLTMCELAPNGVISSSILNLVVLPILAPLLATGMSSSDDRARSGVPGSGSDYSAPCRTPSPTVIVLLLILLFLLRLRLLALCRLLVLRLLLGRRRRWRCLR